MLMTATLTADGSADSKDDDVAVYENAPLMMVIILSVALKCQCLMIKVIIKMKFYHLAGLHLHAIYIVAVCGC